MRSKSRGRPCLSMLLLTISLAGCGEGLEPSGGRTPATLAALEEPPEAVQVVTPTGPVDSLQTDAFRACQATGYFYDRRKSQCSTAYKLASAPTCDIQTVRDLFVHSGFQIAQILDQSLGREGFKDDPGEGYFIDQCGRSETHAIAYLIKKDEAGRTLIREIEAKVNFTP